MQYKIEDGKPVLPTNVGEEVTVVVPNWVMQPVKEVKKINKSVVTGVVGLAIGLLLGDMFGDNN